jgi:peptide/nickel transport system substrate-binding protein
MMPDLSRRAFLRVTLSTAGGALLTACGRGPLIPSAPTSSQSAATSGTATEAPTKRAGGRLRSAIQADIPNVEPHTISPSAYDTIWQAFDRLTAYDARLQAQPMLAESWDIGSDYKQIKLNLRKGVQFHTGREFTSDDVKYNFLRVRDPKFSTLATQSSWWSSIETPDKYTVVLKSDVPRPLAFDSFEYFNMADRETLEGPDAKSKAVGTGPFVFEEWVPGDHIRLVKNKNYWHSGRPYLDEINIRIVRDAQAMIAQLEGGSVDLIFTPSWTDFARVQSTGSFHGIIHPYTGSWYTIGWNVLNPPIDQKLVRQALNYALNRPRFTETLLLGFGEPKSLPWLPNSPAYEADKKNFYAFDLDRARALLKQAGVGSFETEILVGPDFPELHDFAQIFQADLAKIGVALAIKRVESAAFFDAINNRKYAGMYMIVTGRTQLQPGSVLFGAGLNPNVNNSGFKSDRYTQLVSATAAETDSRRAKQIFSELNDLLLDEAFCLALSARSPRLLVRNSVHDLGFTLHDGYDWTSVTVDV